MIDQATIQKIFDAADIYEVVSDFVSLKKRGVNYLGLCPFHNEKTGSFTVSPAKGIYKCFGCGKGGNAVNFIMEHEQMSYVEALKYLAEKYHIPVEEKELTEEQKKEKTERESMLIVSSYANEYFQYQLWNTDEGRSVGLGYLRQRGISDEMIRKFGLGYNPEGWGAFTKTAQEKGYKKEFLVKTGLTIENEKGLFDRFRARVMFPVLDLAGKVIAFGGRTMTADKKISKYLNSPESEIYHKSKTLYGIFFAKKSIVQQDRCILVEGYTDVISMHQAGFTNAVAALGTAFTSGHGTLLKRYTENIILSFDSDEAGQRAILRAIPILKEAGLTVRVLDLTPYKDPDEFIKGLGAQALEERIRKAMSSFMFQVKVAAGRYDQDDPESKTQFQHEAAKLLATIEEPLERKNYIEAVSREYYIGAKDLEDLVNYYGTSGYSSAQRQQTTPRQQERRLQVNEAKEEKKKQPQKLLLTWMVNEPQLFDKLEGIIGPDDFYEQIYHGVALLLFKQYEEEKAVIPGKILNQYTDLEDQKKIAELFNTTLKISPLAEDRDKALNDIVRRVKEDSIEQQMNATNDILRNCIFHYRLVKIGREERDELWKVQWNSSPRNLRVWWN